MPPTRPSLQRRLWRFINHPATDVVLILLIFASIALVIWQSTVPDDSARGRALAEINDLITLVFVVELAIRFLAEQRKARFFRRYWIDVLAVLPFFRPFRLFRVLQLLRIFRLGILMNRRFSALSAAFRRGFGEQLVIGGILVVIVFASTMVLLLIGERSPGSEQPLFKGFWHALRWSAMSLVAGEPMAEVPQSPGGVIVTICVMLGGLTLFATFTGVITAVVLNRLRGGLEQSEMELEDLNGHTIVCGFNRACSLILEELQTDANVKRRGIVVIAETAVRSMLEGGRIDFTRVYFLEGDFTHPDVLNRAGAERAAIAVVLADRTRELSDQDRDARTLLSALTLERMNPSIFTCAELLNSQNEANLKIAGIDEVIARDRYTGSIIAAGARSLGIVGVLKELLTSKWGNQFYKLPVPDAWAGKTVDDVRTMLQRDHRAILIALETPSANRRSGDTAVNPPGDAVVAQGQLLVVIADTPPRLLDVVAEGLWNDDDE